MPTTRILLINYPEVPLTLLLVLACIVRWFLAARDQKRTEWMLVISGAALPGTMLAEKIVQSMSRLRPLKYDEFIYRFDLLFGSPSFALGRFAAHHRWFDDALGISYGLLPIAMIAVFAAYLYLRSEAESLTTLKAFALNLFAALPLYLLLPVCGPAYAFKHFPVSPGPVTPHLIGLAAPPNGVPSVHTSTALLVLFFLWRWNWGKVAGINIGSPKSCEGSSTQSGRCSRPELGKPRQP